MLIRTIAAVLLMTAAGAALASDARLDRTALASQQPSAAEAKAPCGCACQR